MDETFLTMEKIFVENVEDFLKLEGRFIGCSDWLTIEPEKTGAFANVTSDHQWIHVDMERARQESPYKTAIVHGYHILSMLPYLIGEVVIVENIKALINYGIDKLVFKSAVPVGGRIRLRLSLKSVKDLGVGSLNTYHCIIETGDKAQSEMVVEGLIKYIYYFE